MRFAPNEVRFCPQCGAPIVSGARFCVKCGESLTAFDAGASISAAAAASAAGASPTRAAESTQAAEDASSPAGDIAEPSKPMGAFIMIFGAILVVGIVVAYLILHQQLPAREALLASAPPEPPSSATQDGRQLPAGHPTIQLPKEARDLIAGIEQKARAKPNDLGAWDKFGDVSLRAAEFDPLYYAKAAEAYAHVLKADPDNLDALRGVGNIDFDQRKFDEAIAAYEHYLSKQPDNPDVRTDLGTMLLSTGAADQAINQYKKVLETHPNFFEADFNLGIAYGQMNNVAGARDAFGKALKLAPDAETRNRVNQMIASLSGGEGGAASASAAASNLPAQIAQGGGAPTADSFQGAMEQMLRDLPIAGPKVQSVQWGSDTKARVLMDNFPMDQMPPFAAAKFMTDLRAGIDQVKSAHKIAGPVQVDICDAASGRVMQSVTQ